MKRFGRQYESELSFALRSGFAQMDTGWTRARLILRCKNYPFAGSSADDECGSRFSLIDTTKLDGIDQQPDLVDVIGIRHAALLQPLPF